MASIARFGPSGYRPYSDAEQALLRQALALGAGLTDRAARPGMLAEADAFVTRVHAETVEALLDTEHINKSDVAIVGFHGQTVLHRPAARLTVQIGDGAALARRLGLPVAYDFRAADVAAGGQGAPLVPVFHQALARDLDRPHPIAVLNVGGVANVTFVDGGDPIACDTGPGNALIDDFMRARTGAPLDRDGDQAAKGRVDEAFVARVLADGFFGLPYPKSLDRNAFAFANIGLPDFSVADSAPTRSPRRRRRKSPAAQYWQRRKHCGRAISDTADRRSHPPKRARRMPHRRGPSMPDRLRHRAARRCARA